MFFFLICSFSSLAVGTNSRTPLVPGRAGRRSRNGKARTKFSGSFLPKDSNPRPLRANRIQSSAQQPSLYPVDDNSDTMEGQLQMLQLQCKQLLDQNKLNSQYFRYTDEPQIQLAIYSRYF